MRRFYWFVLSIALAACGDQATPPATPAPAAAAATSAAAQSATTPASAQSLPPNDTTNADDAIGYASVAAAKSALADRKDVDAREDGGWTIVADQQAGAFWSFAPPDHAAYPAVVKRTIHESDGKVSVAMAILCEGPATACADLRIKFDKLDELMRADLQKQADARKKT